MRYLSNQIILFFFLFTLINYSQDLISFHNSGNFQLVQKLSFYDINIKGTPFVFEDFVTGQIVFESGKNIIGDFRMDLHAHKIQTKNNDGKIFEISIDNTFELVVDGKRYSFHELDLVENNSFIILRECLELENISLYEFSNKDLKKPIEVTGSAANSGYGKTADPEWVDQSVYIIYYKNTYYEVPKNHKKMIGLKLFDEKTYTKFRKENKINLKREEDLKQLITFFN
tara:strand:- start:49 stop:732 length:684 start_codon:yes stop_codon:yes gene_type:complete